MFILLISLKMEEGFRYFPDVHDGPMVIFTAIAMRKLLFLHYNFYQCPFFFIQKQSEMPTAFEYNNKAVLCTKSYINMSIILDPCATLTITSEQYLRYRLTGSHTSSRITPTGSNIRSARIAAMYAVKMSDVFTPKWQLQTGYVQALTLWLLYQSNHIFIKIYVLKPGCKSLVSNAVFRDVTSVPLKSVFSKHTFKSRMAGSDSGNSMIMLNSWSMCVFAKVSYIKWSSLPLNPSIQSAFVFRQFPEYTRVSQPNTLLSSHCKTQLVPNKEQLHVYLSISVHSYPNWRLKFNVDHASCPNLFCINF